MKRIHKLNSIFAGLVLAGAVSIAQAADPGQAYFSGFIGNSNVEVYDFDAGDTSFRIGGGYQVNENIAIEGYYIDYGDAEDFGVTLDPTAIQLQGVAMLPLNPSVNLYGKLGLAFWDAEACDQTDCVDDDGSDLVFGFGGSFDVSNQVSILVEYEFTEIEFYGDDVDIDTIMAGVNIAF